MGLAVGALSLEGSLYFWGSAGPAHAHSKSPYSSPETTNSVKLPYIKYIASTEACRNYLQYIKAFLYIRAIYRNKVLRNHRNK